MKLSLTGPNSHPDVADNANVLYVGPNPPEGIPHALVDPDASLNWTSLVEAGRASFPSILIYEGRDLSIFEVAQTHLLRNFQWKPTGPVDADLRESRIVTLTVSVGQHPVAVALPDGIDLGVIGDSRLFDPTHRSAGVGVRLRYPADCESEVFPGLVDLTRLAVNGNHDLAGLVAYQRIEELHFGKGAPSGLAEVAAFGELRRLRIDEVWDLGELPSLDSWPRLETVKAHNVSAEDGRRLKEEAETIDRLTLDLSGVRSKEWIERHALSPFREWRGRRQKVVAESHLELLGSISRARSEGGVLRAVRAFVDALNDLDSGARTGLDTIHREDVLVALDEALSDSPYHAAARDLFDAHRSF